MSLMSTQAAHREYAKRPDDEKYPTLQALVDASAKQKNRSSQKEYNLKDLRVNWEGTDEDGTVILTSPKGNATFTNWGFGQFARTVDAPAQYLRTLPARIAADALNYGIGQSPAGTSVNLLAEAPNGVPGERARIRSVTSDSYARVWDAELYSAVQNQIVAHDDKWQLPPTWEGPRQGAYRGDRDSFLILVNGGSIVTDPTLTVGSAAIPTTGGGTGPNNGMFRGLMIRNSEVGASSLYIEAILYRYICGNHLLWGAVMDRQYRRRHVGTKIVREAMREISTFAYQYANRSAERDNAIIRNLVTLELATTKEAVIDELRVLGATKEAAESAYKTAEETETASPRSYWGLAQGFTRDSQASQFQDERFTLDQLASKIMMKGARRVAA